jgi:hypothetical protein
MRILVVADIHANWAALSAIQEPHDVCLFFGEPLLDLPPHLFGNPLDLAGFQLQTSVAEQIFGSLLELGLAARPRHEAPHPRGIGGIDDIQTFVIGETSFMT